MGTATRTIWLDQGLQVLARDGTAGLRIDGLARRLKVTKGSFYHHFVDLADFRRGLLGHFEQRCTTRHIDASEQLSELPPADRLRALADAVLADEATHRGLEVQVRSWASQDDDAHDTVARVDARRLDHLNELAVALLGDPEQAADLAATMYYLLIGSQHAVPAGAPEQLRRLWDSVLDRASSRAQR